MRGYKNSDIRPDTGTGTSPVLCPARPDFRSPQRIRKFRIMGYLLDLDSGGAQKGSSGAGVVLKVRLPAPAKMKKNKLRNKYFK